MSTIKALLGTKTAITVTLTSLANAGARETTVLDGTTTLPLDRLVRVKTNGIAGATGLLEVYAYAALGDTTYTDGATGTDAAFTAANIKNAVLVGQVQMNAATSVTAGPFSLAAAFGGSLPSKVGLIFKNASGAALSATAGDHVVEYQDVWSQVV